MSPAWKRCWTTGGKRQRATSGERFDRAALREHGPRVGQLLPGRVELPRAHGDADVGREPPVAGERERPGVRGPRVGAGVEQRGLLGADHPLAPEVGEVLAGLGLEQVEQAAPVGRAVDRLGMGVAGVAERAGRLGLVGADARARGGPDALEGVVPGACRDRAGEREGGRVAVRLRGEVGPAVVAGGVRPGVERDRGLADRRGELRARVADLELPGRSLGVQRREPLAGPSVGDQAAVEPAVRGLVEHDQRVGPVGDLDPPLGRGEQPGIAAGRPAHGLLDHGRLGLGPGKPDLAGQLRQRLPEQAADAPGPGRVVAPAADDEVDAARRPRRPCSGDAL